MNLGQRSESFGAPENHSWLGSAHGGNSWESITLDGDALLALYTDGIVPSGLPLIKVGTKFTLFDSTTTAEVQTITRTSTGGVFRASWEGHITADIDASAAVTAAVIQTAFDNAGINAVVTGSAGGPFTVTFNDDEGNTSLLSIDTEDATSGTVTVAQGTQGATAPFGDGVHAGYLATTKDISGGGNVSAALMWHGSVIESKLPAPVSAAFKALVPQIRHR